MYSEDIPAPTSPPTWGRAGGIEPIAPPAHQHSPDQAIAGEVRSRPQAYATLKLRAAARGESVPEYVAKALEVTLWVDEALTDDGSIVVRRRRGPWEVLRASRG